MASAVIQSVLAPTGDSVQYDPRDVTYPTSNVVDTFGSVWASKLFGQSLSALEIGSSGKLSFTPCNTHALDVAVDLPAGKVDLVARAGLGLRAANESRTAWLDVGDSGDASLHAPGTAIVASASGTRASAAGSATHAFGIGAADILTVGALGASVSNLAVSGTLVLQTQGAERLRYDSSGRVGYGTPSPAYDMHWIGDFQIQEPSGAGTVRVDSSGVLIDAQHTRVSGGSCSICNLVVDGVDLTVPRGPTSARPAGVEGQVFYNYSTGRFEGFASGAWGGLGGVIDVDQNTFIKAEQYPGANDDRLRFVTGGNERMVLTEAGRMGVGTSNPKYTIDVVGDLRVSGNLLAGSTTLGHNGLTLLLAVRPDGSSAFEDGALNDGAGIQIAGFPVLSAAGLPHSDRFEKSFRWHKGAIGMSGLGMARSHLDESHWKLRGGAFHLSHTNADSGSEVEYILRIDNEDQLQLVRHVAPTDGGNATFDVVAKFGSKPGQKFASSRGFVAVDADKTVLDPSAGTVAAYIQSTCAYAGYSVSGALFPTSSTPAVADVLAAVAAGHGWTSPALPPAEDNVGFHLFAAMHNGAPVPNAILKFVAVVHLPSGPSGPHVSFVINDQLALSRAITQSSISYKIRVAGVDWNSLSPPDKAAFAEWFRRQILLGMKAKGVDVNSINISVAQGSVLASVSMTLLTGGTRRILASAYDHGAMHFLDSGGDASVPLSASTVALNDSNTTIDIIGVDVLSTSPSIVSAVETASSPSSMTVAFEVEEKNQAFYVVRLYALASPTPLAEPVVPSFVASHPSAQRFDVIHTSGSINVALDTSQRAYVYLVSENNAPTPVLSPVATIINEPFQITPSGLVAAPSGLPLLARQSRDSVALIECAVSSSSPPTAYLLLYPANSTAIPSLASLAWDAVAAGAHVSSAALRVI